MILLVDNYDSFSYNLVQLAAGITSEEIKVIRNDEWTVDQVIKAAPGRIILSPGPGRPGEAGICEELVTRIGPQIPILGVCLGHQAICEVYGAVVTYAPSLMHGKQSVVDILTDNPIFQGLQREILAARYHSLAVSPETIPKELEISCRARDGVIMAVRHREYPVFGLQFHPESVLTPDGGKMMENFIQYKNN